VKKRGQAGEIARAKRWARSISKRVEEIVAANPDADRDNTRHTLILLKLPPIERLQRSLIRARTTQQIKHHPVLRRESRVEDLSGDKTK
jgi:hypothetical protein